MTTPSRRSLPGGIQTFRKIRADNYYYVDKTAHAWLLTTSGFDHWFLSRPRRFGKSLFVDTLKDLFEGSEELFRGLAIHDEWDWSVRHPVMRPSFGSGNFKEPDELHKTVMSRLRELESDAGLPPGNDSDTAADRFAKLIKSLHERTGQPTVVLVDEYDKPILDALDKPEVAAANRDYLRGLYGAIKDRDAHIRLSFITGVSKFSTASLFSGLNQIQDRDYAAKYRDRWRIREVGVEFSQKTRSVVQFDIA